MHRLSSVIVSLFAGAAGVPASAAELTCTDEHFVAGERTLPTHDEALAQCREEEQAMTHPTSGKYEKEHSCHDVTAPGSHGEWRHGRIALDVVERRTGDAYTFEALWMCKPVRD